MKDSYLSLHPYVYRRGPEADMYVLQPYEYHASNSELIQMIEKGHHGVDMDEKDLHTLYKWIDFNAPYFGSFEISGRYKATFEQYDRRIQLMQKYANVTNDWKRELADYAKTLETTDAPAPSAKKGKIEPQKINLKKINRWCFDENAAKEMQQQTAPQADFSIEIKPGVSMKFVWIPAGTYMKGTDNGRRYAENHKEVNIDKGFWMGELEVTNQQYVALNPEHDSRYIGQQWKDHVTPGYPANEPQQPVIRVTWTEAVDYCKQLSQITGMNVSLPTEEQWEWACRAGSGNDLWFGDITTDYSQYENLADFTIRDLAVWGLDPTVPMPYDFFMRRFWDFVPRDQESNDGNLISVKGGQYKSNPWGLYDMHGNVSEWTISETDNPSFNGQKVVCGGSWRDRSKLATASSRRYFQPWQAPYNVGFRFLINH